LSNQPACYFDGDCQGGGSCNTTTDRCSVTANETLGASCTNNVNCQSGFCNATNQCDVCLDPYCLKCSAAQNCSVCQASYGLVQLTGSVVACVLCNNTNQTMSGPNCQFVGTLLNASTCIVSSGTTSDIWALFRQYSLRNLSSSAFASFNGCTRRYNFTIPHLSASFGYPSYLNSPTANGSLFSQSTVQAYCLSGSDCLSGNCNLTCQTGLPNALCYNNGDCKSQLCITSTNKCH